MNEYERGKSEMIDRIEWYAKNAIDHAHSRICGDGTTLDARQKGMLECAQRLDAWAKALRHNPSTAYLHEPVGSKPTTD